MPAYSEERKAEIKRAIRDAIAIDPIISLRTLQEFLFKQGITSSSDKGLDLVFLSKLRKKVTREAVEIVNRSEINERLSQVKERYRMAYQKLAKIAYPSDKIMVETKDTIKALETIVKLDLAILSAELTCGVFGAKIDEEKDLKLINGITDEEKEKIRGVMGKWGGALNGNESNIKKLIGNDESNPNQG